MNHQLVVVVDLVVIYMRTASGKLTWNFYNFFLQENAIKILEWHLLIYFCDFWSETTIVDARWVSVLSVLLPLKLVTMRDIVSRRLASYCENSTQKISLIIVICEINAKLQQCISSVEDFKTNNCFSCVLFFISPSLTFAQS